MLCLRVFSRILTRVKLRNRDSSLRPSYIHSDPQTSSNAVLIIADKEITLQQFMLFV